MERDKRHLKILSKLQVFYGIFNVFASFYFYKVTSGMIREYQRSGESTDPQVELALLIGFGFVLLLLGVIVLFCIILAGQSLGRYENYKYCLIVAVLECLIFPLGTVLGIFTIVVLRRESVKELFRNVQKEKATSGSD